MTKNSPTQTDRQAQKQELETLLSLFLEIENTMRAEGETDFAELDRERRFCEAELARLDKTEISGDLGGLDELIRHHTGRLFQALARPHTLEEIEAEVAALDDLLQAYRRNDVLLRKLLDWFTPTCERARVRAQLALHVEAGKNRAELTRLHGRVSQKI